MKFALNGITPFILMLIPTEGSYKFTNPKTKELDPRFHRSLRAGFDARISGDYDVDTNISKNLVADMINQAREFLEAAQEYLKKQYT